MPDLKILKDPAEYAEQLKRSYFTPHVIRIVTDLARLKPALPEDYIEEVAYELKKIGVGW